MSQEPKPINQSRLPGSGALPCTNQSRIRSLPWCPYPRWKRPSGLHKFQLPGAWREPCYSVFRAPTKFREMVCEVKPGRIIWEAVSREYFYQNTADSFARTISGTLINLWKRAASGASDHSALRVDARVVSCGQQLPMSLKRLSVRARDVESSNEASPTRSWTSRRPV